MVHPCLYRVHQVLPSRQPGAGCWGRNLNLSFVAGSWGCRVGNQRWCQPCHQTLQPQILFPSYLQETLARSPLCSKSHSPDTTEIWRFLVFVRNSQLCLCFLLLYTTSMNRTAVVFFSCTALNLLPPSLLKLETDFYPSFRKKKLIKSL